MILDILMMFYLTQPRFDTRFSLEPVLVVPNRNFFSSFLFHNLNSSKNIRLFKHHFTLLSFSHSAIIHCLCVFLLFFWGQIPNLFCFILFLDELFNNIFKLHSYEILNSLKLKEPQFKSVLYCNSSKCLMSMATVTFIDFNFISKLNHDRS